MLITLGTQSMRKMLATTDVVNNIYTRQVNVIRTEKPIVGSTESIEKFLQEKTKVNYHSGLAIDMKNHIENGLVECICMAYDGKNHYEGKSKAVPLSSLSESWIEFMKPAIKEAVENYKHNKPVKSYLVK